MSLPTEVLIELAKNWGAVFIVGFFGFKILCEIIKWKKNSNGNGKKEITISGEERIVDQLTLLNENHLHEIKDSIVEGNGKIVSAINDNGKILSKIEGRLSK